MTADLPDLLEEAGRRIQQALRRAFLIAPVKRPSGQ